jgi:type IV secretion system protein VirB9
MKAIKSVLMVALLCVQQAAWSGAGDLTEKYFSGENPKLTRSEKDAINLSKKWRAGTKFGTKPAPGPNGSVRFVYGAQQPSIVCAVLQVCDIALQPGEVVNNLHVGDRIRWMIEPAVTGLGANEVQHIIVKPLDVGLETSLVVTTNWRTYHIRLRSHRKEYMPQVSFVYPEEALMKWEASRRQEEQARVMNTIPETGEYLGDLSFDYEIDGDTSWKPIRIYNDGRKTIIEMPKSMEQTEAPALLVLRNEGGIFSDDEVVMVNYRIQGSRYVVDAVFEKAILIAGVGGNQDRVTITRGQ